MPFYFSSNIISALLVLTLKLYFAVRRWCYFVALEASVSDEYQCMGYTKMLRCYEKYAIWIMCIVCEAHVCYILLLPAQAAIIRSRSPNIRQQWMPAFHRN